MTMIRVNNEYKVSFNMPTVILNLIIEDLDWVPSPITVKLYWSFSMLLGFEEQICWKKNVKNTWNE